MVDISCLKVGKKYILPIRPHQINFLFLIHHLIQFYQNISKTQFNFSIYILSIDIFFLTKGTFQKRLHQKCVYIEILKFYVN